MKKQHRTFSRLAFFLTALVTLGCGIASQIFPTPTPVFTATFTLTPSPTITPTHTPTMTPTPLPDISAAKIFLHELPAGFEEIPSNELGATGGKDEFKPEVSFAYVNAGTFQMIYGMSFFLVDQMDRVAFEILANQPDVALKQMVSAMGTENVRDEKVLDGLDDLGDSRIGMSMVADMQGMPMRVEILVLRRDIIGGTLISMTFAGKPGSISLHELGKLFDQNMQETLKTIQ